MSNPVSIVTAFVDIGREHWEGVKNNQLIPPYIKRDTKTYFERFERLTRLENPIVCFTETKFFEQILKMRDDITLVAIDNVFEDHAHLINKIGGIQLNPTFIKYVTRPSAPEYWSPQYVAINMIKSHLCSFAADQGLIKTGTSAWIDFGYVREEVFCPPGMLWKFNTRNKINIFCNNPFTHSQPIFDIIRDGSVYIQGCHIVAPDSQWKLLSKLVNESMAAMFECGLVDDDQTALLMAYRKSPEYFILNQGNPSDWFIIFKDFHHD